MKLISFILVFSLLFLLSCRKNKDTTPQGDNEVWLLYKRFNPTFIDIKKGTTLVFMNKDNANHSITEANKAFNSGKIKPGDKYERTFTDSATYGIYCSYHPDNLQEQISITVK
ncbi:MAG: cupredoxin domain-containing protein [Bacteroidia bacterium]|nr:cupredoxin domain-containing protein [Bacteroidia bacterium]